MKYLFEIFQNEKFKYFSHWYNSFIEKIITGRVSNIALRYSQEIIQHVINTIDIKNTKGHDIPVFQRKYSRIFGLLPDVF